MSSSAWYSLRCLMFFSSSGLPNWHHATATSPSKTSAAWARPSRTSRSFSARLASYENSFSAWKVWNHVHQHPPHTPLCRSARSAKASQVAGASGRTVRASFAGSVTGRSLTVRTGRLRRRARRQLAVGVDVDEREALGEPLPHLEFLDEVCVVHAVTG